MRRRHNESVTLGFRLVICMLILFCGCLTGGCGRRRAAELVSYAATQDDEESRASAQEKDRQTEISVFVCGAVRNEGVYVLPEGARVLDAVNAAGGFSEEADTSYLNQAAYVTDAQKLVIPTKEEAQALLEQEGSGTAGVPPDGSSDGPAGQGGDGLIDLNTATVQDLMTIPGIGEVKAKGIITYRDQHGAFGDVSEITNVNGIGDAMLERIRPYITVR